MSQPLSASLVHPYPYLNMEEARAHVATSSLQTRVKLQTSSKGEYSQYTVDKVVRVQENSHTKREQQSLDTKANMWEAGTIFMTAFNFIALNSNFTFEAHCLFIAASITTYVATYFARFNNSLPNKLQDTSEVAKLRKNALQQGFFYAAQNGLAFKKIIHPQENGWLYEESLAALFANQEVPDSQEMKEKWILQFFLNNPLSREAMTHLDPETIDELKYFPEQLLANPINRFAKLQNQIEEKKEPLTKVEISYYISEIQDIVKSAKACWENIASENVIEEKTEIPPEIKETPLFSPLASFTYHLDKFSYHLGKFSEELVKTNWY